MTPRRILWILVAIAVLAAAGLAWRAGTFGGGTAPAAGSGRADIGGPFNLVDQNGRAVDQHVLEGKWTAVFFGYTYCPDVCPATLTTLTAARDRLGPKGKDLRIVFITVDPARDTPAQLKAYLESTGLPEGSLGLTGTPAQTAAAAKAYRVMSRRVGEGPAYAMEHSTAIYLMDPRGRFSRVLAFGLTPDQAADLIRESMRGA